MLHLKLYHLHPIVVHFPIALLLTGFFMAVAQKSSSNCLLYVGTVAAMFAIGLGLLAEQTAPHVPAAWEELYNHKRLGIATGIFFLGLSIWKFRFKDFYPKAFLGFWLVGCGLLMVTGYFGGHLVFEYGMGVNLRF
ncbi:MAG: hypothetical protein A3B70_07855 [Deltaproteobacteria bacterium RIFCSPHIGHO2_02_FULL_40_11]|nr:MAG: hypothetical protein A3B70_07855 [Deltaproteobacteria bacterium RIFCSPHIGHO2_02_FULL_40_11]